MIDFVKQEEGLGVVKVIDEQGLEHHTSNGWKLIAVLTGTSFDQIATSAPRAVPENAGSYSSGTVGFSVPMQIVKHRFLVALDEASAVARLSVQLKEADAKLTDVAKQAADVSKTLKETQRRDQDLADERNAAIKKRAEVEGQLADAGKKLRRYEEDIGKVRNAIGNVQMTRILEGDPAA